MALHTRRIGYVVASLLVAGLGGWFFLRPETTNQEPAAAKTQVAGQSTEAFNRDQLSKDVSSSLWVIVNKRRPLQPADYVPPLKAPGVSLRLDASNPEMQLNTQAVPAVEELFAAAKRDGLTLQVASGYRSYAQQVKVYGAEVRAHGQAAADRESARPGHSEHQTGLAVDVEPASRKCEVEVCFADTPEGKWIANDAYLYGFVIRYPKDGDPITGYTYEPWHLRYVGKQLATELHRHGNPLLETYFGLGPAPNYE